MTNLATPSRSDLAELPAPTVDPVADTAMLPPPGLRVPALAPPALPSLAGTPVVPPLPRFSLDEDDAGAGSIPGLPDAPSTPAIELTPIEPAIELTPIEPAIELTPFEPAVELTLTDPTPADPTPTNPTPTDPTPTMELPVVQSHESSPAHEPVSTPPAVSMMVPSLPTLASAAPAPAPATADGGPALHQPSQAGMAPHAPFSISDVVLPGAAKPAARGGGLRFLAKTITAVALAGVVGVGAHLGYDWWEQRDATAVAGVNVDGTDLASWPQVDPPAIRYTDSTTVFSTDAGTRTLSAHREISSGMTQAAVTTTDAAGVASQIDLDIRTDQAFMRSSPEAAWALTASADAVAVLGDTWTTNVFTVRELFPAEAMPYITVLESVERVLPVKPLQPAAGLDASAAVPVAISTEPTSMVWQYRVIVDIEAFRANETIVFQDWQRRLGRTAVSRIEAWVDNTGIVRQIAVDVDGTKVVHTLVGGSANSARFDTNPLLDSAPAPASIEPIDAEVNE